MTLSALIEITQTSSGAQIAFTPTGLFCFVLVWVSIMVCLLAIAGRAKR